MKVISLKDVLNLHTELTTVEKEHNVSLIAGAPNVATTQEVNAVVSKFIASVGCRDVNVGRYIVIKHLIALELLYRELIGEMQKHMDVRTEIFDLGIREGFEDAICEYSDAMEKCDYVTGVIKRYGIIYKNSNE